MHFHRGDAIGKAGERFVESFVEERLSFIYRKVGPPDLGIDGDIEILDVNRNTTGELVRVQVKATECTFFGTTMRVPLDERHLDYYSSMMLPVILAAVSLTDRKILWTFLSHKASYVGPRGGFGVPLDVVHDEMTLESKFAIQSRAARSNGLLSRRILDEIDSMLSTIDHDEQAGNWDIVTTSYWAVSVRECGRMWRKSDALLANEFRSTPDILAARLFSKNTLIKIQAREEWFYFRGLVDQLNELYAGEDYWAALRIR